jgi:hypothetical protein
MKRHWTAWAGIACALAPLVAPVQAQQAPPQPQPGVRWTEEQLLKVRNVGEKAVAEIAELLLREGLNFGMQWEERDGGIQVLDPGTKPVVRSVVAEAGQI